MDPTGDSVDTGPGRSPDVLLGDLLHLLLCVGCGFLVHRLAESDTVDLPLPGTPLFIICAVIGVLATGLALTATVRADHAGVLDGCATALTTVVVALSLAFLVFALAIYSQLIPPLTTLVMIAPAVAVAVVGPPIAIIGGVKADRRNRRLRTTRPTDLLSTFELATSPPTRPGTTTPRETIPRGFRGPLWTILGFLIDATEAWQKLYTVATVLFLIYIVWEVF